MYLKKFYLDPTSTFKESIDKKFCAENIYGKFLVRSRLKNDKEFMFLDNGKSFFHIKENTIKNLLNFSKDDILDGHSFRIKNDVYIQPKSKSIRFNYFSLYNTKRESLISKLKNSFYQLKKKKHIPLIFLKSVKGGFLGYFGGMVCFVRKNEVKKFCKNSQFNEMFSFFNEKENFFYYPWYFSHLSLRVYYDKKYKLRSFKRKFYLLSFIVTNSKKLLIKKK